MKVKFTGKTIPTYAGNDGTGHIIRLKPGETAEVTEMVGKLMTRKYGKNFEIQAEDSKPAHAPSKDKFYRKSTKTKTKSSKAKSRRKPKS